MEVLKLRSIPSMRKIAVSAVASSGAVGTFDTRSGGLRFEQASGTI